MAAIMEGTDMVGWARIETAKPWKRRRVGLSGQELIPRVSWGEAQYLLDIMLAAVDNGRIAAFERWEELARSVPPAQDPFA